MSAPTSAPTSTLWALSCTRCLPGELPFTADTPLAVLRQHIDVEPPHVHQLRGDVPREVDSIVERCLEKDPARRYQTPMELPRPWSRLCRRIAGSTVRTTSAPSEPPVAARGAGRPKTPPHVLTPSVPEAPQRQLESARPQRRKGRLVWGFGALALVAVGIAVAAAIALSTVTSTQTGLPSPVDEPVQVPVEPTAPALAVIASADGGTFGHPDSGGCGRATKRVGDLAPYASGYTGPACHRSNKR